MKLAIGLILGLGVVPHCHWLDHHDGGVDDAGEIDSGLPDAGEPDAGEPDAGPPNECDVLRLYRAGSCTEVDPINRAYHPQFSLWSDGADKDRFVFLPEGTKIDVTNVDRWSFPVGTRFYKTFSIGGKKLETRLLEKVAPAPAIESWTTVAYQWAEDQHSVSVVDPAGAQNVLGTQHDIPSQAQCRQCHTMQGLDAINGFGAIQLNHSAHHEVTLEWLLKAERLAKPDGSDLGITLENAVIPGSPDQQKGLGYLHANCGHCHGGPTPRVGLAMWSRVGVGLEASSIMSTATCLALMRWTGRLNPAGSPYLLRLSPGHSEVSGIIGRMSVRGAGEQMPPLGTEVVDSAGAAQVSQLIDSLDPVLCGGI